jgi:hypothetical protein
MRGVIYSINSYDDSISVSLEVMTVGSECLKQGSILWPSHRQYVMGRPYLPLYCLSCRSLAMNNIGKGRGYSTDRRIATTWRFHKNRWCSSFTVAVSWTEDVTKGGQNNDIYSNLGLCVCVCVCFVCVCVCVCVARLWAEPAWHVSQIGWGIVRISRSPFRIDSGPNPARYNLLTGPLPTPIKRPQHEVDHVALCTSIAVEI